MNPATTRVLVIGGGFSGMSAAIQLRKQGAVVDLVEIDPGWRSYGAGISLGGATLRAFGALGILEDFLKLGACSDGVDLFSASGQPIGSVPTPRIAGPDVPGGAAVMRPVLARMLADATRASGTTVHLGCTFTQLRQDAEFVEVSFTDGRRERYHLVIGADGLYSQVRQALFPDAPQPAYTGQAVWRAVLPRPPEVQRCMMWLGPKVKTGLNPVSPDQMYLFVTEDRAHNNRVDPARFAPLLADLLAPFDHPLMQSVRAQLMARSTVGSTAGPSAQPEIIFRPLEQLLLPRPWHQGRVVLIGDTVHATTPHLASGACIGIEDALVLAEELGLHNSAAADIPAALLRFENRRWDRCRMVVQASIRLGEIEIAGGDKQEHGRIMRDSMMALAAPI